jgi:hypothetical protein
MVVSYGKSLGRKRIALGTSLEYNYTFTRSIWTHRMETLLRVAMQMFGPLTFDREMWM